MIQEKNEKTWVSIRRPPGKGEWMRIEGKGVVKAYTASELVGKGKVIGKVTSNITVISLIKCKKGSQQRKCQVVDEKTQEFSQKHTSPSDDDNWDQSSLPEELLKYSNSSVDIACLTNVINDPQKTHLPPKQSGHNSTDHIPFGNELISTDPNFYFEESIAGFTSRNESNADLSNFQPPTLLQNTILLIFRNGGCNICSLNAATTVFLRAHTGIITFINQELVHKQEDQIPLCTEFRNIIQSVEYPNTLDRLRHILLVKYPNEVTYQGNNDGAANVVIEHLVVGLSTELSSGLNKFKSMQIITNDPFLPETCCNEVLTYFINKDIEITCIDLDNSHLLEHHNYTVGIDLKANLARWIGRSESTDEATCNLCEKKDIHIYCCHLCKPSTMSYG